MALVKAIRHVGPAALAFYLGATAALLLPIDSVAFTVISSLAKFIDVEIVYR